MNILLIGYRGTGKTTVAQRLAARLGWDWIDADVELERRAGKSIAAIFADDGEPAFRDLESQVLADLVKRDQAVIALGGGVVLRPENRERIKAAGAVVWLTADPATLFERIMADASTAARRPNLTAQGGVDEVRKLLSVREPLYRECAQWIVETAGKDVEAVVDEIAVRLPARDA